MSEDSDKEDYSDRTISDEDESDEDTFMKFVSEDIHQCALLTADSISDPFFPRTTQILLEYQLGRWVPRLREPRDLYGVSSSGPLSPTRWPYHCEVIDEKVKHIDWAPFHPEPVYIPTGLEMEPLYPSSKEDMVVYLAEDGGHSMRYVAGNLIWSLAYKEPCFVYSRVGGNRTPLKQPVDGYDNTLMFEARFESGNLQKVVKVAEYEYQLTVRPDLFTNKHTQWYYFQVTNTQAEMVYRFTIVNFTKPASLYNRGMRPLFYSEKEAKAHNIGWQRIGDQIKYYRNNLGQDGRHFFSLTWTFQFPHNKDTCYFAHCYPYTYTNLQEYLSAINNDPVRSKFCKIRVLCHTLARNMVYVLTITTPLKNTDSRKRKAVILTARVHPGETNSSWIMKGFLDYILGDSNDAQLLRDTFVFKVVPMLNPDGVIVGNYRCSLTGRDLNRNYTSLMKESFPSVWYTRNMVHRLMEKREVILYCDLHGHSRKENIFMYGCGGSDRSKALYLQQRIFPLMLSKNCPDKFSFSSCKFNVQKSKEGTGRVVMWKMGIRNSFTMEATFCGSTLGNKRGTHFNTKDLESMGYHFCDSLLDYCDPDRSKYYQCLKELEEMEKCMNMEKVFEDSDSCPREITLDIESSSRGSDSSESNDSQTYLLKVTSQIKTKKKFLKTKKERNSTMASHQNAKAEVYDREHLLQTHKESNADAKVKIPGQAPSYLLKKYLSSQSMTQNLGKDQHRYFLDTCERPIQETGRPKEDNWYGNCIQVTSLKCPVTKQTSRWIEKTRISTDLHDNLKNKVKECTSFQSKKTGMNWTDDEKNIYRDKRIVQSQELLQYILPIMESPKNIDAGQIKQLFNSRANLPISHKIKQASCINIKRYSTSWTTPRSPLFVTPKSLMTNTSDWLQCEPQRPLGSFSPFKGHKRKCFQTQATKTEDAQSLRSKWETASPRFEMDTSILKDRSLPAEEPNLQKPKQMIPHLTKNKVEQANSNDGLLAFRRRLQRDN
ncbi:PREDICTED: cytosolic carboxypeptidase 3 isoform X4 [Chinchilla lanigera]|nr:PREDICTED: cytosolic carboxypeptidase 3 isoform X4 [Chinchilla lanigera]XP_013360387.1 PREDICTED: cytosolic carboxypeptidase 3 isoform X4 [Chinchilla lanigera]XP_013360388.1 PREDICTED: cytosolic carboxypeptidase 3 isoform X4 [Chinchilla lanigera]